MEEKYYSYEADVNVKKELFSPHKRETCDVKSDKRDKCRKDRTVSAP